MVEAVVEFLENKNAAYSILLEVKTIVCYI